MNPDELRIRCSNCGMPRAEGNLEEIGGSLYCENCLFRPLPRMCDFCKHPEPQWRYQARADITIGFTQVENDIEIESTTMTELFGDWAACSACVVLIEGNNARAMVDRIIDNNDLGDIPLEDLKIVLTMYFTEVLGVLIHPPIKEEA